MGFSYLKKIMANYNQTDITGTEYQRCFSVVINNALNQTPEIIFKEEKVFNLSSGRMSIGCGYCAKTYDENASFPILDLDTDMPIGETITDKKLYQILYSLYIKTANERDQG